MFDIYGEIPVGIDLGTTNSCIGYWNGSEVKIVPNRMGENLTPSVLYLHNDEFIIGEHIQRDLNLLNNSIKLYSLKIIIGQDFNDIGLEEEIKNLHYNIVKGKDNQPLIKLIINKEEKLLTPEELCSLILKKLVKDVEKIVSSKIIKVVISVPAYFDDAQRSATIEAAKLAGLEVIRIINEPTAAALSYGLGQKYCPIIKEISCFSNIFKKNREIRQSLNQGIINVINSNDDINQLKKINLATDKSDISSSLLSMNDEKGKNVLVFDLGGGTFDLAILKLNPSQKEYEVKSKYSDKHLGGDDFDNELVNYCINFNNFGLQFEQIDKKSKERLKKACENAKKILSIQKVKEIQDDNNIEEDEDIRTSIRIDNFIEGKDLLAFITKKQFENEICGDLFERLMGHFDELLEGANLTRADIDEIILVGGSTRMPKIKKMLSKLFKCHINDQINPDEVVAYGATIQAAMLMTLGKNKDLKGINLFDITPISLGTDVINISKNPKIKALGNKMSVIIPKWTRIPTKKTKMYKTVKDNQDNIKICIYEGENDYLKYNKELDNFLLVDLPKRPKGEVECKVIFEIDANNILTVTAFEESKGISQEIKVISNNKNKKKKNISNAKLNYKEFNDFKKDHKSNVEIYIKEYVKAKKKEDKIKILEKYNNLINENINKINNDGNQENIENLEKYYFYVYQLLESYEEILYLNEDEEREKKILEEIKKYIKIFKKDTYYIREIVDLFKLAKRKIFLYIFYESITVMKESGLYYLENLQKMSKYYAKSYFEESLKLYKKYIKSDDCLCNKDIKNKIDEQKEICEKNLGNINSNAILLIILSKKEKKLIDPILSNEKINNSLYIIKNWGGETGFSYSEKFINPNNKDLDQEDYNLIIDELNKIMNKIIIESNEANDDERRKELSEEKGICFGNIIKIKYVYQKGQEYKKYLKLLEDCILCAQLCNKNNNECEWYKEALDLKKEIEGKINIEKNDEDDEEMKKEINQILSSIDNFYNSSLQRFIVYILGEWPYEEYDKDTRPEDYQWDEPEKDKNLIDFLRKKYNPDIYPNRTREEKIRYKVIVKISQMLNMIYDEFEENK